MNENNLSNKLSRIDGAISAIKTNLSIEQSTPIESVVEIIGDGKAEPESNGLHLAQSIDEMNTIANPNENDICIVFAPQTTATAESTFTQISIPAKVTGAGGMVNRNGTFTNAEGTEELRISLASFGSSLTITIMTETDHASIRYSKSGTVYTRTGGVTETETYYFSSPLSLKSSSN